MGIVAGRHVMFNHFLKEIIEDRLQKSARKKERRIRHNYELHQLYINCQISQELLKFEGYNMLEM
jgi:hypothetical protein